MATMTSARPSPQWKGFPAPPTARRASRHVVPRPILLMCPELFSRTITGHRCCSRRRHHWQRLSYLLQCPSAFSMIREPRFGVWRERRYFRRCASRPSDFSLTGTTPRLPANDLMASIRFHGRRWSAPAFRKSDHPVFLLSVSLPRPLDFPLTGITPRWPANDLVVSIPFHGRRWVGVGISPI